MKVMTIVGTRPEIIKLSRVIPELDKHVDHVLIHTGQNYDPKLRDVFFEELGLRTPDGNLHQKPGCYRNVIAQTGAMTEYVDSMLEMHKPDAVLVLGDTNSCLSVYAAKRRHIPIFHMEAGNRCFDQRVPEEVNRKLVDHMADINMPYTEHARRNLLAEGLPTDRIIMTGSPMYQVLRYYRESIDQSDILARMCLAPKRYTVFSAHREENVDSIENLRKLVATVNRLAGSYPVVWPVHPRTKKRLDDAQFLFDTDVRIVEPMGFFDYVKLQQHAVCVVTDSGTIAEESNILGFPAVTIRQAHERPEAFEYGAFIMSDLDPQKVVDACNMAATHARSTRPTIPDEYSDEDVSVRVSRTILSYTDYVKRAVWRQY